jgi:hypothetical protein
MESDSSTPRWDDTDDRPAERQRALDRLTHLVQLNHEVEVMRAGDRPVPLPVLRRAVFAAYRAAVDAGARREATRILGRLGHGSATPA